MDCIEREVPVRYLMNIHCIEREVPIRYLMLIMLGSSRLLLTKVSIECFIVKFFYHLSGLVIIK